MFQASKPVCLLILVPVLAFAQEPPPEEDAAAYQPSPTEQALFHSPVYLPREVSFGALFPGRLVIPQLRIGWEVTLYHFHKDTLYFTAGGGGGYGVGLPDTYDPVTQEPPLDFFYEHVALLGFGYRLDLNAGFYLAVEPSLGALFFGGKYGTFRENYAVGTFEGTGRAGWRLGHAVYGVYVSENAPFTHPPRSAFAIYTGGLMAGLFVNWH